MTNQQVNFICSVIAREEQEIYLQTQIDNFLRDQEELEFLELQKQYEFMQYADMCADNDAIFYGE